MDPFPYSFDNKRYHTLAYHNRVTGRKSQKAALDAGLTCPNIDGTCGSGGCSFCDGGSGYFTLGPEKSITEQLNAEEERIRRKFPEAELTAYFQAHTNTYCSPETLNSLLEEALSHPAVSALAVATRPDCLEPEKLRVLERFAARVPVTVELGLQTVHDETAERFGRGYPFSVFHQAMMRLRETHLRVCVHLIDGLPGENKSMMVRSARVLGGYRPDGVKLHLLHVIRGTRLQQELEENNYTPLTLEEYVDIVISQLEVLPPETVIERITGDGDRKKLLAPLWSRDKIRVLGTINREMQQRDTWQGRLYLAQS